MKIIIFFSVLALFSFSSNVLAQPVHICDDEEEWAPYAYNPRVDGKPDKSIIIGFTAELLDEIFKLVGIEFTYEFTNWKRCLKHVAFFDKSKKYEVFVNGGFSMDRADKYYVTTPIYKTHQGVFYSKTKYPNGLPLKKASDLNNFKACGINGYDYSYIYTKYGVSEDNKMDLRAKSMAQVLNMVSKSRCDIFLNSLEPVYGGVTIGKHTIPDNVVGMPIPNIEGTTFHIFISKSSPRAYELLTKINQSILILQNNGVSKKILKKYLPGI